MISYLPVAGGHIKLAERFVDPAFSFALGWNLWYNWTVRCLFATYAILLNVVLAKGHITRYASNSFSIPPPLPHHLQAEISAAATIINFWHPSVNNAVWITMCLVVAVGINMSGVGKSSRPFSFFIVKLSLCL
jgi:amino acid transporter